MLFIFKQMRHSSTDNHLQELNRRLLDLFYQFVIAFGKFVKNSVNTGSNNNVYFFPTLENKILV